MQFHIRKNIIPFLPSTLHVPVEDALERDRLRRMPNTFLPPILQGRRNSMEGVILLGDSWNMRHPLTGGTYTAHFVFLCINGHMAFRWHDGSFK